MSTKPRHVISVGVSPTRSLLWATHLQHQLSYEGLYGSLSFKWVAVTNRLVVQVMAARVTCLIGFLWILNHFHPVNGIFLTNWVNLMATDILAMPWASLNTYCVSLHYLDYSVYHTVMINNILLPQMAPWCQFSQLNCYDNVLLINLLNTRLAGLPLGTKWLQGVIYSIKTCLIITGISSAEMRFYIPYNHLVFRFEIPAQMRLIYKKSHTESHCLYCSHWFGLDSSRKKLDVLVICCDFVRLLIKATYRYPTT